MSQIGISSRGIKPPVRKFAPKRSELVKNNDNDVSQRGETGLIIVKPLVNECPPTSHSSANNKPVDAPQDNKTINVSGEVQIQTDTTVLQIIAPSENSVVGQIIPYDIDFVPETEKIVAEVVDINDATIFNGIHEDTQVSQPKVASHKKRALSKVHGYFDKVGDNEIGSTKSKKSTGRVSKRNRIRDGFELLEKKTLYLTREDEGIGIAIQFLNGRTEITQVSEEVSKKGIRVGDVLLAVDNLDTRLVSIRKVTEYLHKPASLRTISIANGTFCSVDYQSSHTHREASKYMSVDAVVCILVGREGKWEG